MSADSNSPRPRASALAGSVGTHKKYPHRRPSSTKRILSGHLRYQRPLRRSTTPTSSSPLGASARLPPRRRRDAPPLSTKPKRRPSTMRFSPAAAAAALSAAASAALLLLPAPSSAVNFLVVQPDDMPFFSDWSPPPLLPGQSHKSYPGTQPESRLPWINALRTNGLTMTQARRLSQVRDEPVHHRHRPVRQPRRVESEAELAGPEESRGDHHPEHQARELGGRERRERLPGSQLGRGAEERGVRHGSGGEVALDEDEGPRHRDAEGEGPELRSPSLSTLPPPPLVRPLLPRSPPRLPSPPRRTATAGFDTVEALYPDNLDDNETAAIGTWAEGVDHNMEYVAHKAVQFIDNHTDEDWFLYVNPTAPHSPAIADALDADCRNTMDGDFSSTMATGWSVEGMTTEHGDNCTAYRETVKTRAEGSDGNDDLGSICEFLSAASWVFRRSRCARRPAMRLFRARRWDSSRLHCLVLPTPGSSLVGLADWPEGLACAGVDDLIGAIYKALERTGQLADTMIIFQLDHGKVDKDRIWEGGVRIPQFVHYPAALGTDPRTFDGMVSTVDVGPTIMEYAQVASHYPMDGKSWKAAIDNVGGVGDDWKANRCLFFESNEDRAVRCGCDKFAMFSPDSGDLDQADKARWFAKAATGPTEALFDLCDHSRSYADSGDGSGEVANLVDDAGLAQKASDLRALLTCHLDRTDANQAPHYGDCTGDVATPSPTVTSMPSTPVAQDGGAPKYVDSWPWLNGVTKPGLETLSATVLDDNLEKVRFNVRFPDTTRTSFNIGTNVSSSGDESTWEIQVDLSNQIGIHGYQLKIEDKNGTVVQWPEGGGWTDFLVAEDAGQVLRDLSFRDCRPPRFLTPRPRSVLPPGSVDMNNPDNAGLQTPIDYLEPVVDKFTHYHVTRADIWVLATLEGAGGTQPTDGPHNRPFAMDWYGRPNCETLAGGTESPSCVDGLCKQDRGPDRTLPSPSETTATLLHYFDNEFGLTPRETVALMGAHTLGTLARENSGYNGVNGWLGNTNQLGNGYYSSLVGGTSMSDDFETKMNADNWVQVFVNNSDLSTPDRWEWERGDNPHFVMVNSDIALIRDLTEKIGESGHVESCFFKCRRNAGAGCDKPRCPHAVDTFDVAAEYAYDEATWFADFEAVLKKMLNHGLYDTSALCASPPCKVVPSGARRNLRGSESSD
ncbi:hypothetical protein ACHAWF_010124 [Thalassiosira exigua]